MQDLHNLKIFNGLDKNTIDLIINNSKIEKFHDGSLILIQGDESNGKGYIIKSGGVIVEIGGKEVARLGVGEIFGEIALLNEEKRTATITALGDVETIILTQDDIIEMINNGNETVNKDIMNRLEQNLINNY